MSNFITGSYETPSKGLEQNANAREEPPVDAGVASDGSEEGEIQDDDPVGSKRKRSPSIEQQGHPKRTNKNDSIIDSFDNMTHPPRRLPCVISIDEQAPFGSLYRATTGFVVLLFLDPGRYGPPTVSLAFRNTGTETGKDIAKNYWDMDSSIRGEWAMSQVVTGYAEATDHRMSNPTVLDECLPKDKSNLLYMRFKSWPRDLGFQHTNTFRDQTSAIQASMRTMFRPKNPYSLELWFIAPWKATGFRRHCLRYFTESLASRQRPLDQWQDQSGQYFERKPKLQPPPLLVSGEQDEPLRFNVATKKSKRLPATIFAQTQHTGAAQDTVTGSDNTSYQAEQSTAEPQLTTASRHPENSVPTATKDDKMSDRSPSVPPQTHPSSETQTFGAGPSPSPAQDEPASASDISSRVGAPTPTPSPITDERAISPGFVPFFAGVDIEDEDPESESDLDTESNADRERSHKGRTMVKERVKMVLHRGC